MVYFGLFIALSMHLYSLLDLVRKYLDDYTSFCICCLSSIPNELRFKSGRHDTIFAAICLPVEPSTNFRE